MAGGSHIAEMQPGANQQRGKQKEAESAPRIFRYMSPRILLCTLKQFLGLENKLCFQVQLCSVYFCTCYSPSTRFYGLEGQKLSLRIISRRPFSQEFNMCGNTVLGGNFPTTSSPNQQMLLRTFSLV